MTRLTSPHQGTLIHRFVTKTLSRNILRNHLRCTSDVPSTADLLSLRFRKLHRFQFCLTHASNRPAFPDLPKTNPRESRSTLSIELSSRNHKSHVEQLGSLRDLTLYVCLRTTDLFLISLSSKFVFCVLSFLYKRPSVASLSPWVSRPFSSPSCAPLQGWAESSCGRVRVTCPADPLNTSFCCLVDPLTHLTDLSSWVCANSRKCAPMPKPIFLSWWSAQALLSTLHQIVHCLTCVSRHLGWSCPLARCVPKEPQLSPI
jgi:hypothetical protein